MYDGPWVLLALALGFVLGSLVLLPLLLGKKEEITRLKHRELLFINLIVSLAVGFVFVSLGAGDMAVGAGAIAAGAVVASWLKWVENKRLPLLLLAGLPYLSFLLLLLGYPGSLAQVGLAYTVAAVFGWGMGVLIQFVWPEKGRTDRP
jgi:hypothetical protein